MLRYYVEIASTQLQRICSLVEDLDDMLDEKEAAVPKKELIEHVTKYRSAMVPRCDANCGLSK